MLLAAPNLYPSYTVNVRTNLFTPEAWMEFSTYSALWFPSTAPLPIAQPFGIVPSAAWTRVGDFGNVILGVLVNDATPFHNRVITRTLTVLVWLRGPAGVMTWF
jgi:hypothetical protein